MTTDQDRVAAAVSRVLPELRANAAAVDQEGAFPQRNLRLLRESGLLGLTVPTSHGGLGGGLVELTDTARTLAGGCLSTAMIWAMHCQQVDSLARFGSPELLDRVLPAIARGEVYLASVTTEPGKGGHLLTGVAGLLDTGEALLVERDAPVVTGGQQADAFLITMRASRDAPENQVTLVYAEAEQLEIDVRAGWPAMGMRGTASGGLLLRGEVPASQVVGEPGDFRRIAVESMAPVGQLAWAACWLGAAHSALRGVVELARSKRRPRGLDPRSELVAERLARARMDLELVSAYLHRARAEVLDHWAAGTSLADTPTQIHLNTLKVAAAELTFRSVHRLIQLCGLSTGYRADAPVPLERHFRDLRSASLNYSDDRLLTANGALTLLDREARLL